MPPELEPPTQTTNAEPPTEAPLEIFPYEIERAGATVTTRVRGTLRSVDDETNTDQNHRSDGSTSCPVCASETINGAGVVTCPDCEWVGTIR